MIQSFQTLFRLFKSSSDPFSRELSLFRFFLSRELRTSDYSDFFPDFQSFQMKLKEEVTKCLQNENSVQRKKEMIKKYYEKNKVSKKI